ncbi:MAG: formylglycine-generating enzyme family protein [Sphingobacteriales bacterium]|nr:MAG: formylglycine-generating enzyme family protein [Sphingobacteriales bacterium]
MPTEAQWEYAARGGQLRGEYNYAGSNKLKEVGWYDQNSHSETKDVGLKIPNELGLYDMSGNVWEWCADNWHTDYKGAPQDGSAWEGGDSAFRVLRGGSWFNLAVSCAVAYRFNNHPDGDYNNIGFRLVFLLV